MQRSFRRQTTFIGLRPTPHVLAAMIILAVCFIAYWAAGKPIWVAEHLALIPRRALGPEPWQLVTSAFLHPNLASLLSVLVTFWLFGGVVESEMGPKRLWLILLVSTVAGSLASAALGRVIAPDSVIAGAHPASMAMLAAFGALFRNEQLSPLGMQPVRGTTLALIFIGISVVIYIADGNWLGLAGALAGAGVGWLLAGGNFDVGAIASDGPGLAARFRRWRLRRRYKVIPGGRDTRSHLN
jgi:membrane associated rhomboid family serine protease